MILAAVYPSILMELLKLIGRTDLCGLETHSNPVKIEPLDRHKTLPESDPCRDRFVHLNISIPASLAKILNIRQIWFLGELQISKKNKAKNIADFWMVSVRTGKRDIQQLCDFGIVRYMGTNKTGCYIIQSH